MSTIQSSSVALGCRSAVSAGTASVSTVRSIAYSRHGSAITARPIHSRRVAGPGGVVGGRSGGSHTGSVPASAAGVTASRARRGTPRSAPRTRPAAPLRAAPPSAPASVRICATYSVQPGHVVRWGSSRRARRGQRALEVVRDQLDLLGAGEVVVEGVRSSVTWGSSRSVSRTSSRYGGVVDRLDRAEVGLDRGPDAAPRPVEQDPLVPGRYRARRTPPPRSSPRCHAARSPCAAPSAARRWRRRSRRGSRPRAGPPPASASAPAHAQCPGNSARRRGGSGPGRPPARRCPPPRRAPRTARCGARATRRASPGSRGCGRSTSSATNGPRSVDPAHHATHVSWTTSSATARLGTYASATRIMAGLWRSTSVANASSSPARSAATSAASSSGTVAIARAMIARALLAV